MIEDIGARKEAEAALQRAHQELEQRVIERTEALRAKEQHIREIAANVPGILYQWYARPSGETGFYYFSPRCKEFFGLEPEQVMKDWAAVIHPDDREAILQSVAVAVSAQAPWAFEGRMLNDAGEARWARMMGRPERVTAEEIVYNGFIIDVTEQRAAKQALADSEKRYRALIEGSLQGIVVERIQEDFKPLFVNDVAAQMFGYRDAAEALAEPSRRHLIPEPVRQEALQAWEQLTQGRIDHIHARVQQLRRDGSAFWVELMGRLVEWEGAPALQMTMVDVSERQRMEEELKRFATTDSLTGLFNRRQFNMLCEQEIRRQARCSHGLTALMLDVDHFKRVNDTYGHAAGDAVLRTVAQLMKTTLRESDISGRLGGEEFAALLLAADEASALEVAERLRRACQNQLIRHGEQQIRISVSIGISRWQSGEQTLEAALHRADQALYAAKRGGRNRTLTHAAATAEIADAVPAP